MKKMGLSIMTVVFLLAACGCSAKIADNNVNYSGQVLRGQISSMEKTTVDLVLGKLKENVNGDFLPQDGDFEMPMDPEDRPELPEGEFPFSEGEMPEMPEGMEPFNGEMPEGMEPFNGERPELPDGEKPEFSDGERPEFPDGERPEKPEGGKPGGERPEKPE